MFVKYGKEYADIQNLLGNHAEAARALAAVDKDVSDSTWMSGWDGGMVPARLTTHTEKKSDRVNVKKEKYLSSHRDFVCLQISELRKDVQNRHWTVSKHGWIPNTESFFSNLPIQNIT